MSTFRRNKMQAEVKHIFMTSVVISFVALFCFQFLVIILWPFKRRWQGTSYKSSDWLKKLQYRLVTVVVGTGKPAVQVFVRLLAGFFKWAIGLVHQNQTPAAITAADDALFHAGHWTTNDKKTKISFTKKEFPTVFFFFF